MQLLQPSLQPSLQRRSRQPWERPQQQLAQLRNLPSPCQLQQKRHLQSRRLRGKVQLCWKTASSQLRCRQQLSMVQQR